MKSVSATLAAALDAPVRKPIVRLRIDWNRSGSYTDLPVKDLSADVTSVRYSTELTTDLPAEAKLFAGSAAAEAVVTLAHQAPAGSPEQHGGWYYSPANSASPLAAYDRKSAPALLEIGCMTEAGPEYVTTLTGFVRSLEATSSGREASLRLSDPSEEMRGLVYLPAVIADLPGETSIRHPGLNTIYLADWVARRCGFYASPPPRPSCLLSATMHGSAFPDVGAMQEIHGATQDMPNFTPSPALPTQDARFVQALHTIGASGADFSYILDISGGAPGVNNGQAMLYEGWHKLLSTSVDQPLFIAYRTGQPTPFFSAFWQSSTGRLVVTFNRGGADPNHATTAGPVVSPGTTNWHYYGFHISFSSTGAQVTFRYDASTTGPETVSTGSFTGTLAINTCDVAQGKVSAHADGWLNGLTEAPQLTREASAGNWNNAYTPTALIQPSTAVDMRLLATPEMRQEGWSLLQEIARAEFATTGFNADGLLTYWTRDRWTRPPADTVVATLTAEKNLKELALVEATDQVVNQVEIRSATPQFAGPQTVWKLGDIRSVPAGGTITILAHTEGAVGEVDTSVAYGTALGSSRYLAGDARNGTGNQISNLTITVTQLDPQTIKIVVANPNGFRVYLTGDNNASATFSGKPYLWIDAVKVSFGDDADGASSATTIVGEDAASIARFKAQVLPIADSDLRQQDDDLQVLADDLVADLGDPPPAIQDVPIVGDPRHELADRVRVLDPDGLALDGEFHLSKIDLTVSPGEGMAATVSLRGA